MQNLFYHSSSGNETFRGNLLTREITRAISLHPIKESSYQYRMDIFLNVQRINELRQTHLELRRQIFELKRSKLNYKNISLNDRFNVMPSQNQPAFLYSAPKKRSQLQSFSFFNRVLYSVDHLSPKRGLESHWRRAIQDTVRREVMSEINKNSKILGRIIDYKEMNYGYMRYNPLIGIDYIIDMQLVYRKYEGRKMTLPVRKHAYLRSTFTDLLFRDLTNTDEPSLFFNVPNKYRSEEHRKKNKLLNVSLKETKNETFLNRILINLFKKKDVNQNKIFSHQIVTENKNQEEEELEEGEIYAPKTFNFVLPLKGRWETFKRFIKNFEDVCFSNKKRKRDKYRLIIVLFDDDSKDDDENNGKYGRRIESNFKSLKNQYSLEESSLRLIKAAGNFSRSVACELGAQILDYKNSLIIFIDVDIVFSQDFLHRARLNAIEGKQVYYPIVYSEYNPNHSLNDSDVISLNDHFKQKKTGYFNLNENDGYWRQFGFGIVVVYNSDLRDIGGFNRTIIGWGKEDVDLFDRFVKSKHLEVFRAVDPGLVHVYHKIECDSNLNNEQYTMCLGSKAATISSQRNLNNFIYQNFINIK
jgi:chondroitin sulfate synthase